MRLIKELVFLKELSGKTTKTFYLPKEKYLLANQVFSRIDGKHFCKNRVIVKADIPPSISEETVGRVLKKANVKWTHFQGKGILTKDDLKLRLTFVRKGCRKHAMCNYEI